MKKYRINILILILISFLVIFFSLKDDITSVKAYIIKLNYFWILVAIFFSILNVFLQSLALHIFLKEVKNDYKISSCFKLLFCAQFFNGITPFSSGGQPFQVYLLNKEGIKVSDSVQSLLQCFITYQLSLILIGAISIILNRIYNLFPNGMILKNVVIIGFIVNLSVMGCIIFFSRAKKTNTKFFNKFFDFIFHFKFIKNKEEKRKKAEKSLNDFYDGAVLMKNNLKNTLISFICNFLSLISLYFVPLFIFYSLGEHTSVTPLNSIVSSGYTYLIGSFIPIPGAAGGLEYGFLDFFGAFSSGSLLSVAMLLWRIITYYFMMVIGGIVLILKRKRDNI